MQTRNFMAEKMILRKLGNSAGIILSKGILQAFNMKTGDLLEVEFDYPKIIINTKPKK